MPSHRRTTTERPRGSVPPAAAAVSVWQAGSAASAPPLPCAVTGTGAASAAATAIAESDPSIIRMPAVVHRLDLARQARIAFSPWRVHDVHTVQRLCDRADDRDG